ALDLGRSFTKRFCSRSISDFRREPSIDGMKSPCDGRRLSLGRIQSVRGDTVRVQGSSRVSLRVLCAFLRDLCGQRLSERRSLRGLRSRQCPPTRVSGCCPAASLGSSLRPWRLKILW